MKARKGLTRQAVASRKYNISMQVTHVASAGGVFVGGERRELTRIIKLVCSVNSIAPCTPYDIEHFFTV